ncbi:MAG TPA: DUF11 domain-containing protein [Candidatus Eisenbergiella intestinigallinarum]|uniref:DUF11 domain-containing protein n=1 Tax=Candidatus Eisenbergiella intestinigallinarum TaxID=2838549 RepID=A0A9D2TQK4_9FIRM|nr:DUF11 domain-containing protein [Candidatus Eisenbergiella intestinigallinarum]
MAAFAAVMMALIMFWGSRTTVHAAGGLSLSTEYPGVTITPGETLNITLTLTNTSGSPVNADVAIASLPDGWEGYLQGGDYEVNEVHVGTASEGTQLTLHLTVPDSLEEGTYTVQVDADVNEEIYDSLTLSFEVNEVNAGAGSFTTEYPEQEGTAGTSFSFSTTLINNGLSTESYSLSSSAPSGWQVSFVPSDESTSVASIEVESSTSQGLTVEVVPPEGVEAGEYDISCSAVSASETLTTDLKVVITGTYGISLSTPDGRLSFDSQANKDTDVTLTVTNTGNEELQNVTLTSSLPSGWEVTYDVEDGIIDSIAAGSSAQVVATVTPSSEAITGDYVATFTAETDEATSSAEFRVSVKTSTLWGFVAVLIILCVAAGLVYVFRKYGRR